MLTLEVPQKNLLSQLHIERGLLQKEEWVEKIKALAEEVALITDESVREVYGHFVLQRLKKQGLKAELFVLPTGERAKTRENKGQIEDAMHHLKFGKKSVVVALGGGVVSDVAGFIAATFARGIPYCTIATSLLAQVDASIGGKVAINTAYGKNLIGAFHHPSHIFIDPNTLETLPPREWRQGMAEIIKYGLIASLSLLEKLEQGAEIEELILESCSIKIAVVSADPCEEKGFRRILNFGHTLGHAIEIATQFAIGHGDAIAYGMLLEAYLSHQRGYLSLVDVERIKAVLKKYELAQAPLDLNDELLWSHMEHDKKNHLAKIRFVLLEKLGRVHPFEGEYCIAVEQDEFKEAFAWLVSK